MYNISRMKLLKIIPLMFLTLILVSNISSVAAVHTHIDGIAPITCEQGDKPTINAQLWIENALWDNPLTDEKLYFYIYDNDVDRNIFFSKTATTSWPTGEASVKVDTTNFAPGNYTVLVHYDGGADLVGYDPCGVYTTFNVKASNKTST